MWEAWAFAFASCCIDTTAGHINRQWTLYPPQDDTEPEPKQLSLFK